MGADLDGVQAAVVHVAAVMGAAGDGAFDGGVGGAGAPVVGTVRHSFFLQKNKLGIRPEFIVCRMKKSMRRKFSMGDGA